MIRRIMSSLIVLTFATALAACGDTWRGAKQDTGENIEATGEALDRTGEKVKR
ncbi:MAG: entericidin B signal peptide protein [Alphaproteobacteria bacterium]